MIRFGVIGTNWITERFLEAAREAEGFELAAVYSRTEEKAKQFAEKHGIPQWFTSIEELAASEHVDAIYIASPNSLHAQQAMLCMNHGKHVLCEKPLASNVHEVRQMLDTAERNGVVLMEALKTTMLPAFEAIRMQLPKLGKVRRYFANYCQYSSRYDEYRRGNVLNAFKPEFSNGALMDLGIYCLYPQVALFGKPSVIKATGVMLESGVDGEGSIVTGYEGMDAVVMYSKITDSSLPSEIQGEDACLVIDKISEPSELFIRYRDGREERVEVQQDKPVMTYEAIEFMELIRQGNQQSATNSWATSLAVAEIMEEARKQLGLVYPADQQQ
ncbi:oxidoreductase [Paenibacillus sp. CAA11]|uniref:Gfo/Idh/MocA family protein n=1 Tax=Paenibacillus sp. CAA11 TaxID=1532905 RepID=UPI000D334C33|nr:Gfo/Idh/MocA family oxidoreductase [Paenibacillus sp. CAA11]AWB46831.1 oxidoreductase [Paenibacillus sp. CAA11]